MNEFQEQGKGKKGIQPIAVIVVAVAVVAVLLGIFARSGTFKPVIAGTEAHEFTLPDLDGRSVSLSDFRGKVVFLNFWATWCKPCEDEMPSMQALYESLSAERPFVIVAVSLDSEGPEVVREFVRKHGITFPVLHDRKGRIKELYKTTGVPETFIVDQNGMIAEKVWGPRDWTNPAYLKTIMTLLRDGPMAPGSY